MKKPSSRASRGNLNFHARIVYKSGTTQDFLLVAPNTTIFQKLRDAFNAHLNDSTAPDHGFYVWDTGSGSLTIRWTDVSSVQIWVD